MNMHPKTVLITGANRGIGLEFVRQFLKLPTPPKIIFATCRNPDSAEELKSLAKSNPAVEIVKLDVADAASVEAAKGVVCQKLQGAGLNLLINNAGVFSQARTLDEVTAETMIDTFKINVLGPMLTAQAFIHSLKVAATELAKEEMSCSRAAIINISTRLASIADNTSGGIHPYRVSKCGLNMLNKNFSLEFKPSGILAVLLHPGWVQTHIGSNASTTTASSVSGMMAVMNRLKEDDTGKFFDFRGDEIPW